ncbi:hypothetical protein GOBAR_AA38883 [Gossypium barbadense]|uniref:Uncharacterized protein n=1 Tax=Gossypium barbadense TaxID=3634 RepID=A0A2P5VSL5_GOSBA|nr:hypothetical protein GOBAR_AA38883 [Gossypium barbadense]
MVNAYEWRERVEGCSTATIQCCQGAIVRFASTTLPFAGQKLYQDCRMQTEVYHLNSPQQNGNDSSKRWTLTPPGWVKLNTDGTVALYHSWAAAVAGGMRWFKTSLAARTQEDLHCQSDSEMVVQLISDSSMDPHSITLVRNIQELRQCR